MRGSWRELLLSSGVAIVVLLAVWGRLPPVIVDASVAVPETVSPGEVLEIERTVRTTRHDCYPGEVHAQFIDSHKVVRPLDQATTTGAPAAGVAGTRWTVPETMPAGPGSYRATVTYPCFPFYGSWPVQVVMPEVHFWVRDGRQRFGTVTPGTP